jgi:hypothetical protein
MLRPMEAVCIAVEFKAKQAAQGLVGIAVTTAAPKPGVNGHALVFASGTGTASLMWLHGD